MSPVIASGQAIRPGFTLVCRYSPISHGRSSLPPFAKNCTTGQSNRTDSACLRLPAETFTIRSWSRQIVLPRSGAAPASVAAADLSASPPEVCLSGSLVTPDQREVCRLSPRDHVAAGSAGRIPFLCSSLCAFCGSTPIRTITARPSLSPSSFTRCPIGSPCGSRSLGPVGVRGREDNRLTTFRRCTGVVRPHLYAGGSASAPREFGAPGPGHVPFGPSVSAACACPM